MEKNNTNDWHGAQNKGKKDSLHKGFYCEPKIGGRVRICGFYNNNPSNYSTSLGSQKLKTK